MALTLTVSDNQDGSGATATVTGTGGAAVSVWTQMVAPIAAAFFTQAGSRTGDGTLALPGTGTFWAYAIQSGAPSGLVLYAATTSPLAVVCRARDAMLAVLKGKTFAPVPGKGSGPQILTMKVPNVLQAQLPAIVLSVDGLTESPAAQAWSSEAEDLTGWPVKVSIIAHSSRLQQDADLYLTWRWIAMKALQNRSAESAGGMALVGAPEVYRTEIEPGPQLESDLKGRPDMPEYMGLASEFLVRCLGIEKRG